MVAFSYYDVLKPSQELTQLAQLRYHLITVLQTQIPDFLVTENENEFNKSDFTHFPHAYNVFLKSRTPYAPRSNGIVENNNRQPNILSRAFVSCTKQHMFRKIKNFPLSFQLSVLHRKGTLSIRNRSWA